MRRSLCHQSVYRTSHRDTTASSTGRLRTGRPEKTASSNPPARTGRANRVGLTYWFWLRCLSGATQRVYCLKGIDYEESGQAAGIQALVRVSFDLSYQRLTKVS